MKLKRSLVEKKYRELIEGMYACGRLSQREALSATHALGGPLAHCGNDGRLRNDIGLAGMIAG